MTRLSQALQDPSKPSYPRHLRTIDQAKVLERADKYIQAEELKNWLTSSLPYGSGIWDTYKVQCINDKKPVIFDDFIHAIKKFIHALDLKIIKNDSNKTYVNESQNFLTTDITLRNIIQYGILQKWFTGLTSVINETVPNITTTKFNSTNMHSSLADLLLECCEELEMLSRDYSNDEGQHSSVAAGVKIVGETEHPDELIEEGVKRSMIRRIPMQPRDWKNPVPENSPDYLQLAYPFIFLSGNGCGYEERPRDIKFPKTSWLKQIC